MKIAVLANSLSKEEMQQKCAGIDVSIEWIDSVQGFLNIADADAYFDLEFLNEKTRIDELQTLLPKPVFINSIITTLKQINQPFIRINAWNGFLKRQICEMAATNEQQKQNAEQIFNQLKWDYRFVPDVTGMISAKILAMIINEAYYTLQDEVSTKHEIDLAMKLGTNYPYGPFEWSEKIGLKNIYDLLLELSKTDSRYKISEALEKEAKHKWH
ncbi:MAG TPA: 3-hydroxyacyl-CoA dehydrogenase family protein [Puia sp.]|nr:3-hydroxyacyl-CoA dehydrogenase family protein [Puia sp.]